MATSSLHRTSTRTDSLMSARISGLPQPASVIAAAARAVAVAAGELRPDQYLAALPDPRATYYRNLVRLIADPDGLAEAMQIQLRRSLTQQLHGTPGRILRFDNLHLEDRYDVADAALVAWETIKSELAGTSQDMPTWERNCLTFSGEYDPRLLALNQKIADGTVQ